MLLVQTDDDDDMAISHKPCQQTKGIGIDILVKLYDYSIY